MLHHRHAWLGVLLSLAACGGTSGSDLDAGPDAADVADVAPPDTVADADVGLEADVAPDADAAAEDDAGADDGSTVCPPFTVEESDLIYAGADDATMTIVTNDTPDGDAFLHEPSVCVDPTDPTVAYLISRMRRTLSASFGGVGISAVQVGVHRRIFLAQRTDQAGRPVQAFLNPQIVEYSADTATANEGCLSVPGASPAVLRSLSVVIDYDGEDAAHVAGETIGGGRGTLAAYAARIVQHEYDHLQGILITDPR